MEGFADGPLELEMLPAGYGDALLLTWGPPQDRHRLLVDGGPAGAYSTVRGRLREVAGEGPLELMVLTHVDADHIEGTLLLSNDADLDIGIREYWFNGPAQIMPDLGGRQGEMLAALISGRGIPLNAAFGAKAVCAPDTGARPVRCLPGGLTLTVLGPDAAALTAMRKAWLPELKDGGLAFDSPEQALEELRRRTARTLDATFLKGNGPPDVAKLLGSPISKDRAPANRSSIVLLAEYAGNAVLLPGDATPAALRTAVRQLLEERGLARLHLAALKLPHHGSARNITPELLQLLPADAYLFSSDGAKFGHPDDAGVARCLAHGKKGAALAFNYHNPRTLRWGDQRVLAPRENRALHPPPGGAGLVLSIPPVGPRP
ncbi:MAG TPA: hypothetical protein VN520_01485 [Streptomyces sp.]|uniref:ComEC/Rec2 family competence protein n=1 Tax=Streptomyces sp. TaxID=1931 RepID=UPI002CF0D415|nr:hypothetical protein [Streptomyces sp.]HWU05076.1 hypothetical protein [Streptomyces sp.]